LAVLRALRYARGIVLFALLVISGSVPVSIAALLHEGSDDTCEARVVAHDESAHRIGAPRQARSEAPHCVVCHWLQSVQTIVNVTGFVIPSAGSNRLTASDLPSAHVADIGQLAARAPPLS
jgi:hypothetical protein